MTFSEMKLSEPLLRALEEKNYSEPTPIQSSAIPVLLRGKDILGIAQTGTGKTAAFALPIIEKLHKLKRVKRGKRWLRALILSPTRELAIQIGESFAEYSKHTTLKQAVIFGGVNQNPQVAKLRHGVDILVATPGRLLDLIGQGFISLEHLEFFVLDEADCMLDMGFIHDIRKVIALLPKERQTMLFSATMPREIVSISKDILHDPKRVEVTPESSVVDVIDQSVYYVDRTRKMSLLIDMLGGVLDESLVEKTILIFSRTKHGADKIAKSLGRNKITCEAIHGNKSQNARQSTLKKFKNGSLKIIVATDIAARGIDVKGLGLVINFDLPEVPETYVHRIGRTGRAGSIGMAYSFCADGEESKIRKIEKLTGNKLKGVKVPLKRPTTEEQPA